VIDTLLDVVSMEVFREDMSRARKSSLRAYLNWIVAPVH
jgi:hypothetical protein